MELKMFSIYDEATQNFNTPFFMLTKTEAIRAFKKLVNEEGTNICEFPNDFRLYLIGKWDNISGDYTKELLSLVTGNECKEENPQLKLVNTEEQK